MPYNFQFHPFSKLWTYCTPLFSRLQSKHTLPAITIPLALAICMSTFGSWSNSVINGTAEDFAAGVSHPRSLSAASAASSGCNFLKNANFLPIIPNFYRSGGVVHGCTEANLSIVLDSRFLQNKVHNSRFFQPDYLYKICALLHQPERKTFTKINRKISDFGELQPK